MIIEHRTSKSNKLTETMWNIKNNEIGSSYNLEYMAFKIYSFAYEPSKDCTIAPFAVYVVLLYF